MFDIDRWREIFQAISKNKLRTVLTGFTVAFAIMLFTVLFGLGNGLLNTFKSQFAGDAENAIYVRAGETTKAYKGLQMGRRIQLKNDDYRFLIDEFGDKIQYISARRDKFLKVIYKSANSINGIRGVHPDHQFLEENVIETGRFITNFDLKRKAKVAVIGRMVQSDLFDNRSALHKDINIGGINYKVVGVFSDTGGDRDERYIYIPITTAQATYGNNNDHINRINLTFNPNMSNAEALRFGKDIQKKLKRKHSVSPKDQNAIFIYNRAESMNEVNSVMGGLNGLILFIGLGTLIAGIIGISNIMVFVVKERTKELGIRKALGATPRSIISMILQETVLITALSGYLGMMMGVGILKLSTDLLEEYFIKDPSVSTGLVVGATITLVLAGILAGYLPAKRAARIKPIEALNAA